MFRRAGHPHNCHNYINQQKRDMRDTSLSRFLQYRISKSATRAIQIRHAMVMRRNQKARQGKGKPVALFSSIVALFAKNVALGDLSMSRFPATIKQISYVAIANCTDIVASKRRVLNKKERTGSA